MPRASERRAARNEPIDETALRDALDALFLEGSAAVAEPKLLGVVDQMAGHKFEARDSLR